MKLAGARKNLVKNVVDATIEGGGDGDSIIVCKYVDVEEVVDYIQECLINYNPPHSHAWNYKKRERDILLYNDGQESIIVISFDKYKLNPHKYRGVWDEVFVII